MCNSVYFSTKPLISPFLPAGSPPPPTNLYFLCPFGQIETVIEFGIATNQSNICPTESKYGAINNDPECNFRGMGQNYTNFITDNF
jgi:hypothetical protein